ncbi:MAG: phosphatidylglycerol lysyltransferase domain-containing protein [Megasphaera sp.]|jgi:hypothetical protein|uniref:DUF2156 domain-containing protein n=1 Tax=Megasphaera sueciensis TaxID=349094 RepID=UPI003D08F6AB|nr:phosphatidylglycerol lysyltransferase domain-containing protein [Megasphaera sp.]
MFSNALRQQRTADYDTAFTCDPKLQLHFRKLQLFDKEWIDTLLKAEDSLSSVGCFGTLYLWGNFYGLEIAKMGSRLISRYTSEKEITFGYPMGSGNLQGAILAMWQSAKRTGISFVMRGVTEQQVEQLKQIFPDRFSISETRDTADYIYEAQALAQLAGNKLHGKRNHCNQFMKRYPDWRFEILTADHVQDCLSLLEQWETTRQTVTTSEQTAEPEAIKKSFAAYDELHLDGGILFVGNQPVAFTMGEKVGRQGFDVRFEKAETVYDGSYTMINREFVRFLLEKYKDLVYINREEDLGLENLRKAKLSYKPILLLKKYDVYWKE